MMKSPIRFVFLLGLILLSLPQSVESQERDVASTAEAKEKAAQLEARIKTLIEQLGSPQYASREKAQAELERLGLVAFDAVYEARNHDDIEIALRSRYLMRALQVAWSRETDSPEVKRILQDYGDQNGVERRGRMDRLAQLDQQGLEALCRLARFETVDSLSKYAALLVMNYEKPKDAEARDKLIALIAITVGTSKRPAAQWLSAYAKTLEDAESSISLWAAIATAELQEFGEMADDSDREVVRGLFRWYAQLLQDLDRKDEAIAVIGQSLDLLEGTRAELLGTLDWLIEREHWPLVDQLAKRFAGEFDKHALLIYRLAEASLLQDKKEQAGQSAERAFQVNPQAAEEHIETGYALQERGFMEWAQREYRHVLTLGPLGSRHDIRTRFLLSELLHDGLDHKGAAEVLKGVVDAMEQNAAVADLIQRYFYFRKPGSVRSRLHYFYARDLADKGEADKQLAQLQEGVVDDPNDADVLIALYRASKDSDELRKEVVTKIEAAATHFRQEMANYGQNIDQARKIRNEQAIEVYTIMLASANNQFAWLVGNTEGDYKEALACSKRSLELKPESAGYMDTLSHCYFALGDLENAVKTQSRAAELDPHSKTIARQLEVFKKSLESKSKSADATE